MDHDAVRRLLAHQGGVIARRQLLALGGRQTDVERMIRRREWVRLLPGVFVDHTGQPAWVQRAWAGVLFCWPAALADVSALRAVAGPGWRRHDDRGPIRIAVCEGRKVRPVPGYVVRRVVGLDAKVQWNAGPPRLRFEEAALDVASGAASELDAIGVLADACQTRRTTAHRMLGALEGRTRLRRRTWLGAVLRDIADGTCSVLEHGYLTRVERAHGLPRRSASGGRPGAGSAVPRRRLRPGAADRRA